MDIITYALLKKKIKELEEKIDNLGKFLGITTSQLVDGCSTNPIIIDNEVVTAKAGDWVIRYDTDKEFAFNGLIWQEFGDISNIDYGNLLNKPSINDITLIGNKSSKDLGIPVMYSDTKQGWDSQIDLVSEKDAVYIYTDYDTDEYGNNIPGIKIGDGLGYLIDAPFLDANMQKHILDNIIHITQQEREFWNNKVTAFLSEVSNETLILTKD